MHPADRGADTPTPEDSEQEQPKVKERSRRGGTPPVPVERAVTEPPERR